MYYVIRKVKKKIINFDFEKCLAFKYIFIEIADPNQTGILLSQILKTWLKIEFFNMIVGNLK
jgi:hypothetical protein